MEKIKKAMEKARSERQANRTAGTVSPPSITEVSTIKYTQTQSIDIPREIMNDNRMINAVEPGAFTDSIKILKTQVLQRMEENRWNTLAVTSPGDDEGKTLTVVNLGVSLAMEMDYTVLLVDANLKHPCTHEYFGIKSTYGLSDYLLDDIPISDILINPKGLDRFVFLPGGKPQQNSSEMLGSPKMSELVNELKTRYPKRIILFDLPSLLGTADSLTFAPYVDAVLLVIEDDKTRITDLRKSVEILSSVNIIGTVLNKAK